MFRKKMLLPMVLFMLPAFVEAKSYPWKIETIGFNESIPKDRDFAVAGMEWARIHHSQTTRIALYTHPQIRNKCLVEAQRFDRNMSYRKGWDVLGGIWMKRMASGSIKFVDCYPLNGNSRGDEENAKFGAKNGIGECYSDIGFTLTLLTNTDYVKRGFDYSRDSFTYVTVTSYTSEWQWKDVQLGDLTNTAQKGETLKNLFYDSEAQVLHFQEKVKVKHTEVVKEAVCGDD